MTTATTPPHWPDHERQALRRLRRAFRRDRKLREAGGYELADLAAAVEGVRVSGWEVQE